MKIKRRAQIGRPTRTAGGSTRRQEGRSRPAELSRPKLSRHRRSAYRNRPSTARAPAHAPAHVPATRRASRPGSLKETGRGPVEGESPEANPCPFRSVALYQSARTKTRGPAPRTFNEEGDREARIISPKTAPRDACDRPNIRYDCPARSAPQIPIEHTLPGTRMQWENGIRRRRDEPTFVRFLERRDKFPVADRVWFRLWFRHGFISAGTRSGVQAV